MRPTIFLLLLYYDWFVAIVSSSTGSPSMSFVRRFRAFPAVFRVGLFLTSDTDVVWPPVVELLSVFRNSTLTIGWFLLYKLWNAMHPGTQLFHHCSSLLQYWILWYWLSGKYQACIPHLVCLWQELLPLDGNHASSLYVLHRKTPSISSFSYRWTYSY